MGEDDLTERSLPLEARRALEEAVQRRADMLQREKGLSSPQELHGRGGLDPVRYKDWEVKGIAVDF